MMLHFKDFRPRLRSFLPVASAPALDIVPRRVGMSELLDDVKLALLVTPPPADQTTDVAIGDWNDLICAVKDRLTLLVRDTPGAATDLQLRDRRTMVQTGVLDCVSALDQLHSTLTHELQRCRKVERDAFEARLALAQARQEQFGSRAGERRARHPVLRNGLTLLPDRGHFGQWLDRALTESRNQSLPRPLSQPLSQPRSVAVLSLDLGGFTELKHAHGHTVGDELLKIVAARLLRALRAEDNVGQVGGGEFACLLFGPTDREALSQLACSLFDSVSGPIKLGALKLRVSPSIGIAVSPDDGATSAALLAAAVAANRRATRHQTGYAFSDQQQPEA